MVRLNKQTEEDTRPVVLLPGADNDSLSDDYNDSNESDGLPAYSLVGSGWF
jgi:hypothetical protein